MLMTQKTDFAMTHSMSYTVHSASKCYTQARIFQLLGYIIDADLILPETCFFSKEIESDFIVTINN